MQKDGVFASMLMHNVEVGAARVVQSVGNVVNRKKQTLKQAHAKLGHFDS